MFDNDDVCVIEDDYEVIDDRDAPDPNKWQAIDQLLNELDVAAGVCWHPAIAETEVSQRKPSTEAQMKIVRREIAARFVQMDGKFIPTQNKDGRLGKLEIEKILPQMLAERFPFDEVVKENAEQLTFAAIYGNSADPRLSFGVYSGSHTLAALNVPLLTVCPKLTDVVFTDASLVFRHLRQLWWCKLRELREHLATIDAPFDSL